MSDLKPLTPRQRQLCDVIEKLSALRGFPPTLTECAVLMKVHPSRVAQIATSTVKKGWLSRDPKAARSWRVTRSRLEADCVDGAARRDAVNWQIRTGELSVLGPGSAMDIVVGRLEYIVAQPGCNREKLMAEAIEYARLVRGWIREHEPMVQRPVFDPDKEYIGGRPGGKPGPMSDG